MSVYILVLRFCSRAQPPGGPASLHMSGYSLCGLTGGGGGGNRIVGGGPLTGLEVQRRRPWCLVFGRSLSSRVPRPWMPECSHAFATNSASRPAGLPCGGGAHRRAAPTNGSSVTGHYHRGPVHAALGDERLLWRMPQSSILSERPAALGRVRGPEADWRRPWCKERQIDVKSPLQSLPPRINYTHDKDKDQAGKRSRCVPSAVYRAQCR